jgi:D-alanyl-D-alanine carboxypeptidase
MRQTYRVPGVEVAVTVPGQGCFVSAAGLADTAGSVPLQLTDQFPIGSITKTFTATVILQLVQQGKLSLSAPISRWVPNVQYSSAITVKMLLNMTSGIYNEPGGQLLQVSDADPNTVWTPQQIVDFAEVQGPAESPGQFYYSDTNYIILGMIAQAVTGKPIQELITQRILEPLHLSHTSFATAAAPPDLRVQGYDVAGPATPPRPNQFFVSPAELSWSGAAGAMISTVADLQVWARALATGTLLSPSMQRQRLQLVPVPPPPLPALPGTGVSADLPTRYGLGIYSIGGLLGHKGAVSGYNADMFYLPAKKATIIVLVNARNTSFLASYGEDIGDAAAISIAQIVLPNALTTQS